MFFSLAFLGLGSPWMMMFDGLNTLNVLYVFLPNSYPAPKLLRRKHLFSIFQGCELAELLSLAMNWRRSNSQLTGFPGSTCWQLSGHFVRIVSICWQFPYAIDCRNCPGCVKRYTTVHSTSSRKRGGQMHKHEIYQISAQN